MISFSVKPSEVGIICQIAQRAYAMVSGADMPSRSLMDYQMDITATHANGCPLDLERLLDADDFNFAHDVFGIARHLNRDTGQLERFLPRMAAKAAQP